MKLDLLELQKQVYQNKIDKGFNVKDIAMEFCLMNGEMNEAWEAWLKKDDNVGEELADVAIYLLGLAEILEVDLGKEILDKMQKNKKRQYNIIEGVALRKDK
jgi:NTP pyrophosphatase (non-canonical NTP hydrolase)